VHVDAVDLTANARARESERVDDRGGVKHRVNAFTSRKYIADSPNVPHDALNARVAHERREIQGSDFTSELEQSAN
jgi:hypothetical protein